MNLAKINEFVKASPAIQIQSKISLLQRRAWNVLLANAYNELPNQEVHHVSMVELAAKLGFDSKNEDYLKATLKALVDCKVEWNILDKDKVEEWGVASLLAEARIKNGICTYAYPPYLRYKLYNPRIYTKLNLRLQNRFKSQYALVLWELCFDYFDTRRDQGETPYIPLDTFRDLLGIQSGEYPAYSIFNRAVIKPALKEINKETGYHVELEQKRLGRRVGQLKFHITRIKKLPVQESLFPDIENLPPIAVELVQARVERKIALRVAAREWNFVNPEKLPLPDTYPDFMAYVAEKIEMSIDAMGVRNRAGYIIEAIRENYEDEQVQKERQLRAQRLQKEELRDLAAEYKTKRNAVIRQAVHADPELVEIAAKRIKSYVVRKRLEQLPSVAEAYQAGGMVTAEIHSILEAEYCQELVAPVIAAYEEEKARIIEKFSR